MFRIFFLILFLITVLPFSASAVYEAPLVSLKGDCDYIGDRIQLLNGNSFVFESFTTSVSPMFCTLISMLDLSPSLADLTLDVQYNATVTSGRCELQAAIYNSSTGFAEGIGLPLTITSSGSGQFSYTYPASLASNYSGVGIALRNDSGYVSECSVSISSVELDGEEYLLEIETGGDVIDYSVYFDFITLLLGLSFFVLGVYVMRSLVLKYL